MRHFLKTLLASTGLALAVSSAGLAQSAPDQWSDAMGKAWQNFEGDRSALHSRSRAALYSAMFVAANAVDPAYNSPVLLDVDVTGADADYAAHAAADILLTRLFGEDAADASTEIMTSVAEGLSSEAIIASTRVAEAAVDAVWDWLDYEQDEIPAYRPFTTPGQYVPTQGLVGWRATASTPIMLESRDELFPDGPPALDSDVWARDFNEVSAIGSEDSETRTEEQTFEAWFWVSKDWEPLVEQVAERRSLSALETSRIYAMTAIATSDAGLTTFAAKHHFQFWRPETAIPNADLDGREDTDIIEEWTPLLRSPMHPEYPCAHCSFGAAVATVLDNEIPLGEGESVDVYADDEPDERVAISSFAEFSERMSMSRIYGGVHYRTSNEHAEWIGHETATRVLAAFRPIE